MSEASIEATEELSDEKLSDLDALEAAATPGPWFAWDRGVGWHIALDPRGDHLLPEGFRTDLDRGEDARLIAAARNAVPALVAEVRRLRAVEQRVREAESQLAAIKAHGREGCREWPDGEPNRCFRPAAFILWGKLFPPEALGPRCEDHAAQYTRTDLHTITQSAIFDLRPLADLELPDAG